MVRVANMKRTMLCAALLIGLSGCTAFGASVPYPQSIDDELNAYQKSVTSFVTTMELDAGTPQGSYDSEKAKAFYAESAATLSNLALRTSLLTNKSCPLTGLAKRVSAENGKITQAEARAGISEDGAAPAFDASANCMSIMIRDLQNSVADLQADHKSLGKLTPHVAGLDLAEIDGAIRVALEGIRSKKY
jgi:hypothetical protein